MEKVSRERYILGALLLVLAVAAILALGGLYETSRTPMSGVGEFQQDASVAEAPVANRIAVGGVASQVSAVATDRERLLVRQAELVQEVESVDGATSRLRAIAEVVGGRIERVQYTGESPGRVRQNLVHLRVPEPRLDEAIERARELGEVERFTLSEQEVTEQAIDLEARLNNRRRLEDRLLRILEQRTGDLEDVLGVERELARVREEIERYDAQLRNLEREATWSLLGVTLHEPYPMGADPEEGILDRLARAFVRLGQNLLNVTTWAIAGLGYVVPLALIAVAVLWIYRRYGWGQTAEPVDEG